MPEHCSTCLHWSFVYNDGIYKFGRCSNELAIDDIRVVQDDDIEGIFTEECFGCVWHEWNNKVRITFESFVNDVLKKNGFI